MHPLNRIKEHEKFEETPIQQQLKLFNFWALETRLEASSKSITSLAYTHTNKYVLNIKVQDG